MNNEHTNTDWIARQEVIHVEQTIEWLEKKQKEYSGWLYLFEDRLESHIHHYPLRDVFDISFRWEPGQIGFLYLHTTSGVRTFQIKTDPSPFIDAFRQTDHI
ncbi:hypothetical protein [Salibacterium halotolerans]|uniref:Uncharacterized protein n=1 Tax=Salibacterium halotolerans TaxID=1884432 RepID=A0A1I5UDP5_9BACI|nr:hypothetical protein [Salibacterium halotolerans]SFP93371.1 hypothetical protein SAMN05518683_11322 [Salibacterium halotolerans]